MQEKETLESLLKDRNYTDMVRGTSLKDTIELAKQGVYDEIFIPNVISLVYQLGKCSKCVVDIIKELREKDVNIHFIEEDIDTRNRRNDLHLGTLIGEAVYQMAIEMEEVKDGKEEIQNYKRPLWSKNNRVKYIRWNRRYI